MDVAHVVSLGNMTDEPVLTPEAANIKAKLTIAVEEYNKHVLEVVPQAQQELQSQERVLFGKVVALQELLQEVLPEGGEPPPELADPTEGEAAGEAAGEAEVTEPQAKKNGHPKVAGQKGRSPAPRRPSRSRKK